MTPLLVPISQARQGTHSTHFRSIQPLTVGKEAGKTKEAIKSPSKLPASSPHCQSFKVLYSANAEVVWAQRGHPWA